MDPMQQLLSQPGMLQRLLAAMQQGPQGAQGPAQGAAQANPMPMGLMQSPAVSGPPALPGSGRGMGLMDMMGGGAGGGGMGLMQMLGRGGGMGIMDILRQGGR